MHRFSALILTCCAVGAAGTPLLAQTAALPDSLVVVQGGGPTGWQFWLDTIISVATAIIALGLVAAGLAAIPIGFQLLRTLKNVNELFNQIGRDIAPLIKHGHAVAENADYISTSVRMDVEHVREAVTGINRRLDRLADNAERRIRDFDALLKVMQEEAEDAFIDTAAAIRGVRSGTATFRRLREDGELEEPRKQAEIRVTRTPPEAHNQPRPETT